MPVESIIGTNPKAATIPVMRTGRSRASLACSMASRFVMPLAMRSRIAETSTSPSSIDAPARATNPTPAEMVKGSPMTWSPTTPPTRAKRTPLKIIRASRTERNVR